MSNKCKQCQNETNNPKFCSRSCAASYNNAAYPKRKSDKKCKECSKPIDYRSTYCSDSCKSKNKINWNKWTLSDLKKRNKKTHSSVMRYNSRNVYIRSRKPMACSICKYDIYVEICHIRAIKDFDDNTKLSIINSIDNLVPLCPNHHKEYDLGLISL